MTKDQVIALAQAAGFVEYELDDGTTNAFDIRYKRFADLVRNAALDEAADVFTSQHTWISSIAAFNLIRKIKEGS